MDFHSLFPFIFWKHCKPKVLQHHPSLQNADLFFVKQRLKLKCLQSGNHPKFEHLPGTISTHKKYQSFFQLTFQDIDFFFFSNITATSTKGGKWVYTEEGIQEVESYTSRALKLKSALLGLTRRVIKQGNKFTEGHINPLLTGSPSAGSRLQGTLCLPTSRGDDAEITPSSHSVGGQTPCSSGSLLALKSMNLLMLWGLKSSSCSYAAPSSHKRLE